MKRKQKSVDIEKGIEKEKGLEVKSDSEEEVSEAGEDEEVDERGHSWCCVGPLVHIPLKCGDVLGAAEPAWPAWW